MRHAIYIDEAMNKSIHIAPMMGWTDRHGLFLLRRLTKRARLWTEMIAADALIYGDRARLCPHIDHVLQIGGADPKRLAEAARIGEALGFGEINLNMGCPSRRVGQGGFGAAMMADLDHAAKCVEAMRRAVECPVSVKCRISIDRQDPGKVLPRLLARLSQAGARSFAIHARAAWLSGLSPKQNRTLPPLRHDLVYQMKRAFPHLHLILNGGVQTLDAAARHLRQLDGVMIGRAAFRDPFMLADLDARFFADDKAKPTRQLVLAEIMDYALREKLSAAHLTRLVSGLWARQRGAGAFRRRLNHHRQLSPDAAADILAAADALAA